MDDFASGLSIDVGQFQTVPPTSDQSALPRVAKIVHTRKRGNLVCVRAGNQSVFEKWFRKDLPRSWDLLVSHYAAPTSELDAETVSIGGLSKFSAIRDMFLADGSTFGGYRYIWFLDDDIELAFEDVDVFFDEMTRLGLSLAQPALSPDSFMSWAITRVDPTCSVRYTNFVEIMMPAFSQSAFQLCVDSFDKSISGFGLDYVWPKLLSGDHAEARIGIIDTVVARHTRAIDFQTGPFYVYLRGLGIDFRTEFTEVCKSFAVADDFLPKVISKVLKAGASPPEDAKAMTEAETIRRLYLDTMERVVVGMIYRDQSCEPWGSHSYNEPMRVAGRDWPTMAHSMIGLKRLHNLRELTEAVILNDVPGDLIETGVWRGGACIMMRAILKAYGCTDRRVFLADSFAGLPTPDPKYPADEGDNHHTFKELIVSVDEVRDNFNRYGLLDDQVVFLQGWFRDTLPTAPIERLAILRLDGDMYESTSVALTSLYPRLSVGGFCIVDDGNVPNCRAAVADFKRANEIEDPVIDIDGWGFYWRKS